MDGKKGDRAVDRTPIGGQATHPKPVLPRHKLPPHLIRRLAKGTQYLIGHIAVRFAIHYYLEQNTLGLTGQRRGEEKNGIGVGVGQG